MPLLVRFPGGAGAGTEETAPVSLVDVPNLVAEVVGLELPEGVEGVPVGRRELVLGEWYRDGYWIKKERPKYDRDMHAVIRWPWKLIESSRGERQLFRLDRDPRERKNQTGHELEAVLQADLEQAFAALSPAARPTAPPEPDAGTLERLRRLGYVE